MTDKVYETKPLNCWGKAKELRNRYFVDYVQAKEKSAELRAERKRKKEA